jgi:hypothetical protein
MPARAKKQTEADPAPAPADPPAPPTTIPPAAPEPPAEGKSKRGGSAKAAADKKGKAGKTVVRKSEPRKAAAKPDVAPKAAAKPKTKAKAKVKPKDKAKAAGEKKVKKAKKVATPATGKYEIWVAEAIAANATEEHQYVSINKIRQYLVDYMEGQEFRIRKMAKVAALTLLDGKLLKAKKDSYAFTKAGKAKIAPETIEERKKVVRQEKKVAVKSVKDGPPKGAVITASGRVSKPPEEIRRLA